MGSDQCDRFLQITPTHGTRLQSRNSTCLREFLSFILCVLSGSHRVFFDLQRRIQSEPTSPSVFGSSKLQQQTGFVFGGSQGGTTTQQQSPQVDFCLVMSQASQPLRQAAAWGEVSIGAQFLVPHSSTTDPVTCRRHSQNTIALVAWDHDTADRRFWGPATDCSWISILAVPRCYSSDGTYFIDRMTSG